MSEFCCNFARFFVAGPILVYAPRPRLSDRYSDELRSPHRKQPTAWFTSGTPIKSKFLFRGLGSYKCYFV